MSLPPDVTASIADNDRTLKRYLLFALMGFMCIVWAFVYWRVDVARANWFEQIAHIDTAGVEVNATIITTRCKSIGSTRVSYRWNFEGREYEGSGAPCKSTCQQLSAGDEVGLRFVPARPRLFACLPGDKRREAEAPAFLDALPFLTIATLLILVKLFESYREPTGRD
jgi:hypothetical protein